MAPRRLRPARRESVPDWLTPGTVLARVVHSPGGRGALAEDTREWLHHHGLGAEEYDGLCRAYDALREAGNAPEAALTAAMPEAV